MFLTPLFFVVAVWLVIGVQLGCLVVCKLINSQIHKFANSQIRQLTNSPTHKLASSSTYELTHLYINKVYILVMLSLCKETQKLALRFDIFLKKACVVFKKALPLHPLSGTKFSGSN